MASPQMVARIQNVSRRLNTTLELLPQEDLFNSVAKPTDASDYLFEMKVLFGLLDYLTSNQWVGSVTNRYQNTIRLPRSPGLKANFSYFSLQNAVTGEQLQLVHGTQVTDACGELRAPDLSLQVSTAGNTPTFRDVKAIWDAKLRGEEDDIVDDKMKDSEYRSFTWVRDKLRVPRPNTPTDPLTGWPAAFEVSGLITNGHGPTENDAVLLEDGISITRQFQDASTPTHPRRHQHR